MLLSPILYNGNIISLLQKSVSSTENFNPCRAGGQYVSSQIIFPMSLYACVNNYDSGLVVRMWASTTVCFYNHTLVMSGVSLT